jgi:hypothetical protein
MDNHSFSLINKLRAPSHSNVAAVCENMAGCYRTLGKTKEAENLEVQARKIHSMQE